MAIWSPRLRLPSFEKHLEILEYERARGWPRSPLGARFSWLEKWLINRDRVAAECDVLIWGANPLLGAAVAAGLARQGKKVVFAFAPHRDQWDYPVAAKGIHDDILEEAALPKVSLKLFVDLARYGKGSLAMAWGYSPTYRAGRLCLLRKDRSFEGNLGESQKRLSEMMKGAFGYLPRIDCETTDAAMAEMAVFAKKFIWVSDPKDGAKKIDGELSCDFIADEMERRIGSGRWFSQNPLVFAQKSREDIAAALTEGGWGR